MQKKTQSTLKDKDSHHMEGNCIQSHSLEGSLLTLVEQ